MRGGVAPSRYRTPSKGRVSKIRQQCPEYLRYAQNDRGGSRFPESGFRPHSTGETTGKGYRIF